MGDNQEQNSLGPMLLGPVRSVPIGEARRLPPRRWSLSRIDPRGKLGPMSIVRVATQPRVGNPP